MPSDVSRTQPPRVWCLLGHKAGDNTQVSALANALGWQWRPIHIHARPWELAAHLSLRVTLAGIDRRRSSELVPPWPDLVISAGRRNEPVARWIQSRSGGLTRLIHIGRPWAPLSTYDLIVTTPQYNLPALSNIQHNTLPLHDHDTMSMRWPGKPLRWRHGWPGCRHRASRCCWVATAAELCLLQRRAGAWVNLPIHWHWLRPARSC